MAVYVDNPRKYKKRGKRWCHLFSDNPDLKELHDFAKRLELKRQWFDGKRWPHYDVTPEQANIALRIGALHAGRMRLIQIAKPAIYEKMTGRNPRPVEKKELTKKPAESTLLPAST